MAFHDVLVHYGLASGGTRIGSEDDTVLVDDTTDGCTLTGLEGCRDLDVLRGDKGLVTKVVVEVEAPGGVGGEGIWWVAHLKGLSWIL